MAACRGCGGSLPSSKAYKQRVWCSDACRVRFGRQAKAKTSKVARRPSVAALRIAPGDVGLVDRVRTLVVDQLDGDDDVAGAQGALAIELALLAADGSVSACRELRLLLLEMRLASDPSFEGEVTQALMLEALLASLNVPAVTGLEPAGMDVPPGWRSTAQDGETLDYLGRRWCELRAAGDDDGAYLLERWAGVHMPEIRSLREMAR